jgi:hypothetical protein
MVLRTYIKAFFVFGILLLIRTAVLIDFFKHRVLLDEPSEPITIFLLCYFQFIICLVVVDRLHYLLFTNQKLGVFTYCVSKVGQDIIRLQVLKKFKHCENV